MKILLLTSVPLEFNRFWKSSDELPFFQPQSFWVKALHSLKHTVKVFRYTDAVIFPQSLTYKLALTTKLHFPTMYHKFRLLRNRLNTVFPDNYVRSNRVIKLIEKWKPDVLIYVGGISELTGKELITAKRAKAKRVLIHGVDPLIGATCYERKFIRLFDLIVVNDKGHQLNWSKLGAKKVIVLPYTAIDPDFHNIRTIEKKSIDVLFVGTLFLDRQKQLKKLVKENISLKIYGFIPKEITLDPALIDYYIGEAWGDTLIHLYNKSIIVINLVPEHMPIGGNLRTFEIPGCGALQFANRCPSEWFEPDKEIVLFEDTTDLVKKLKYYLKNSNLRESIALAGYKRTHRDYTYEQRFKKILKLVQQTTDE